MDLKREGSEYTVRHSQGEQVGGWMYQNKVIFEVNLNDYATDRRTCLRVVVSHT